MVLRRLFNLTMVWFLLAAGYACAQTPPPATVTLSVPAMSGPLALSASPPSIDTKIFGTWYIDGAFSGLGLAQSQPAVGDRSVIADISNAQIFVQKIDGLARFYVQLGAYALPTLGQSYAHEVDTVSSWGKFFDAVPQAFVKIAPSESLSFQIGKLPTLIGDEATFTFENVNIERGLLWAQEPAVSRGVQANAVVGPLGFSVSLNDGFYSGRYTWLSGSASWTINPVNVLVLAAGANLGQTSRNTLATPLDQNNSSIYNLIYTYTKGPLMISPYFQYGQVQRNAAIGIPNAASLAGGAVIATYAITPAISLGGRIEYEASSGSAMSRPSTNLLYGPGSSAASVSVTPTYTHGHWFVRGDMSAVDIFHPTQGDALGSHGDGRTQVRVLLEAGYVF